jgi:hypothetical protein
VVPANFVRIFNWGKFFGTKVFLQTDSVLWTRFSPPKSKHASFASQRVAFLQWTHLLKEIILVVGLELNVALFRGDYRNLSLQLNLCLLLFNDSSRNG